MACVCLVFYKVLLNGKIHGFIKLKRGLRQDKNMSHSRL